MSSEKIILAGGTGLIGHHLTDHFANKGYEIVILSRDPGLNNNKAREVFWDGKCSGAWQHELENAKAIINLSGKPINSRFTESNKSLILHSRIDSTRIIGKAIRTCTTPPKVWINSSAIGYYGPGEQVKKENSSPGTDFIADVCKQWEHEIYKVAENHSISTRIVTLRTGIVLSYAGGALPQLVKISNLGLGGQAGDGNQYMSWIHYKDLCKIFEFIINNESVEGPINAVSPEAVTNKDFMEALRKTLHVSIGIPQPAFAIKAAELFIGTPSELILEGQNVYPEVLTNMNFNYSYPNLEKSLDNLLN